MNIRKGALLWILGIFIILAVGLIYLLPGLGMVAGALTSTVITIVAFLVIFSFLVIVHEFGHFFAAIKSGVKVEEFGFGIPPKAKTLFKKGDTDYTLNWIPFGGFVRMLGQSDFDPEKDSEADHDPRSFRNKPYWKKAIIISAGVFMNFLAAYILLVIIMLVGFHPLFVVPSDKVDINIHSYLTPTDKAIEDGTKFHFQPIENTKESLQLLYVAPDSQGEELGFEAGDTIIAINGTELQDAEQAIQLISKEKGNLITFTVVKASNETRAGPETVLISVPTVEDQTIGLQFSPLEKMVPVQFSLTEAPIKAAEELGNQMLITLAVAKGVFGRIFTKAEVPKEVAGPVGIIHVTSAVAQKGFMALLLLTIIISINLGIMNILPIPALDGGHLVTITIATVYEKIFKKKPNPKIEATIHGIGFGFLMLLILMVTWNDVERIIKSFL